MRRLADAALGASHDLATWQRELAKFFKTPTAVLYPGLPFDITPVTDNRPFFFYTVRGSDFIGLLGKLGGMEKNNLGLAILQLVLLVSTVFPRAPERCEYGRYESGP